MDRGSQNYTLEMFYSASHKATTTNSITAFILQLWGTSFKLIDYGRVTQGPTNTILLRGENEKVLVPWFTAISQFRFVPLLVTVKHVFFPL